MTSKFHKGQRYESGSDHDHIVQRPCSSSRGNPDPKPPATSSPTPSDYQLSHASHHRMTSDLESLIFTPPATTTATTRKRRARSTSSADLHQPIGFVCCHCRYHSSGLYCSNPEHVQCPHRMLPRCTNCPIIFTSSSRPRD
ncbi:hypothetical protein F5B18DRAFT_295436 [Nemania serpens]|nr:hypothetical protein F5B18DRAFT_295436 [Nemania serpens]